MLERRFLEITVGFSEFTDEMPIIEQSKHYSQACALYHDVKNMGSKVRNNRKSNVMEYSFDVEFESFDQMQLIDEKIKTIRENSSFDYHSILLHD